MPPENGFTPYQKLFERLAEEWPELRNDVTDLKVQVAGIEGRAIGKARTWSIVIALLGLGLTALTLLSV